MSIDSTNALFHALAAVAKHKPVERSWRGKPVRDLTPEQVEEFADWAFRHMERLRKERNDYFGQLKEAEFKLEGERKS